MSRDVTTVIIGEAVRMIGDRSNWTRFASMRTRSGGRRFLRRKLYDADRYCAFTALVYAAASASTDFDEAMKLARAAEHRIVCANNWPIGTRLSEFNDTHTHAQVLSALARAVLP